MGVKFFKKNICDLSNTLVTFTVTDAVATEDGADLLDFLRNRENKSAWVTTDSTDAALTEIEIDFTDIRSFDSIILIKHNLKSFTIQYWSGGIWNNFSTPINETTNTLTTNLFSFTEVMSTKIKLVINGTMVANADKILHQIIVTESLGEFTIEPKIDPRLSKDKKVTKFLSGKSFVAKSVGGFEATLQHPSVSNEADLLLVETLFEQFEGFLFWPSGGTTSQYETIRVGWRLEDIFFVAPTNDYEPEWVDGFYKHGLPIKMKLVEVN